mgnify:CR=1 FL=1
MRIGVLAVQGAFAEHEQMLERLGAQHFQIRQKRDLGMPFDGLVLPGGESTVMGRLLRELDLFGPLGELIRRGLPVFGTCAGLLLLADKIENDDRAYFRTMSITARRNAYGRQLGSFETHAGFRGLGEIPMVFIRAPYIVAVSGDAQALAEIDGRIVAARQGNQLATAFHPELTDDVSVHRYFLRMAERHAAISA